jgi:hypothetical protein
MKKPLPAPDKRRIFGSAGLICPVAAKVKLAVSRYCPVLFCSSGDATPYGVKTLKPPVCQFSDESI